MFDQFGIMALGLVLASLILSSVVGSVAFSSATRAGVQSQASADAGIAVAQAGVLNGTCTANGGVYQSASGAVPEYRAEVWRQTASGWEQGCPASISVAMKIIADGDASAGGVAGNTSRDTSTVEALYEAPLPPAIAAGGAAVYAHEAAGFSNAGLIYPVDGSQPDVHIRTGNFVCANSSSGVHNLIVAEGDLTVGNSCGITGSVWAAGDVDMSNSASLPENLIATNVSMRNSVRVNGNVWATANLDMKNSSQIGGFYVAASKTGSASATKAPLPAPPAPPMPFVPNWVDYNYDHAAHWGGFAAHTLSGSCDATALRAAVDSFGSAPGVIDARGCSNGITLTNSAKITVRADLALIANEFTLANSGGFLSSGGDARLWLISPDTVADGVPSCPAGGGFSVTNSFDFSANIPTMIYTPCAVNLVNSINITGQIYAGTASLGNSASLGFVAVGLPGVDLAAGPSPAEPGPVAPVERSLVAIRNIGTGG